MPRSLQESTIYSFPHAFINRKGEPILVTTLNDQRCGQLIDMYLAYEPRNSFQGLPPIQDSACRGWVQHMIGHGVNLVALSFAEGVVGHVAVFPINDRTCELLVVVSPPLQNLGIGSELVRCAVQLADELEFEKIRLTVSSNNTRARHVYKKCGFEHLTDDRGGEVDMAVDLRRYRETVRASVASVMNRDVISIRADQPCRKAVEIFLSTSVASLPVVDKEDQLVGIISKTDFMLPSKLDKNVADVLTREVLTVQEGCAISKVITMLQSKRVRAIPVVDGCRKLVGVVGRKDILAYYARHFS
jgi:CBS domain-containing protein